MYWKLLLLQYRQIGYSKGQDCKNSGSSTANLTATAAISQVLPDLGCPLLLA